jgi:hypothetical protein
VEPVLEPSDFLSAQHQEMRRLFGDILLGDPARAVGRVMFRRLSDLLATHMKLEEALVYPALRIDATEDFLLRAVEEHLLCKRVLADLLRLDAGHPTFRAKLEVLRDLALQHAEHEERVLLPVIRAVMSPEDAHALGSKLLGQSAALLRGKARGMVLRETDSAASIY